MQPGRAPDRPSARPPGTAAALGAALLFGASAPAAKQLLGDIDAWLLAGLLYLGSGIGLSLWRRAVRPERVTLAPGEWRWLAGAVLAGGIVAPLLLLAGLSRMPASGAALLLNAEAVFTALLAWFAFGENVDRRVALGMLAIVAGALVLGWSGDGAQPGDAVPALAVLLACLCWAVDNNLTRRIARHDATWLAAVKGLVAGTVNLAIALAAGSALPAVPALGAALALGFASYGVSLALYVVALRQLGTARAGAYFAVAPFFGASLAVAWLGEPFGAQLAIAGALMALGVWLHLSERHVHEHVHDAHHQHAHAPGQAAPRHTHWHRHEPMTHSHPHYPDEHHRHRH